MYQIGTVLAMNIFERPCTPELLKKAFKKLLAYVYYDKSDMYLRRSAAEFVNKISQSEEVENEIFERISRIVNGVAKGDEKAKADLVEYLEKIRMQYFPKKLKVKGGLDKRFVSNEAREENVVERLLIKPYIPIELQIIDVLWIMQYAKVLDASLSESCCGNRLVINSVNEDVELNEDFIFHKYSLKYQNWWMKGIDEANKYLKDDKDITIINLDITNFYHSVDVDFDAVIRDIRCSYPWCQEVGNAGTTRVVRLIHQRYRQIVVESGLQLFAENKNCRPLPLSLLSSAIIANWYLKPLDDYMVNNLKPIYYARYVDDLMIVVKTESEKKKAISRASDELKGLMKKRGRELYLKIPEHDIDKLKIQQDKVYVYSFTSQIPQLGIEKYVNEQVSRSSEFRFITDEVVESTLELENVTLVGTMDANYEDGKRFDILEESRYRLSVYLAKLASRLAKNPEETKYTDEVKKLHSYFSGSLLIKHYQLWERIATIFVLAGRYDYVDEFEIAVSDAITQMKCGDCLFVADRKLTGMEVLKRSLSFHLAQSIAMALSLKRGDKVVEPVYTDAFLVRMHFNSSSLQEFMPEFAEAGIGKSSHNAVREYMHLLNGRRWIPYYVKFYDVLCACSLGREFSPVTFEKAWALYCDINGYADRRQDYKKIIHFAIVNGILVGEFNADISFDNASRESINVSLIGMDIKKQPIDMIKGLNVIDVQHDKRLQIALDKITEIPSTHIFMMPECSLSISELMEYCRYSAKHEMAFVCGLEYYMRENVIYNYIVTCLPLKLYGRNDALPVIRLKNFYAPLERKTILNQNYYLPESFESQAIYHWRGHVFSTYCCFELCNPQHRSFFFNYIDAMYCPVHNPDTYYFNNIAESTARDMHCFFVLSNVSGFGDSRVSVPAKHDRMNLLKVKGGNTSDNVVTVLSCTLDYNDLRDFQKHYNWNKEQGNDALYKPLPPGFNQDVINRREDDFLFKGKYEF